MKICIDIDGVLSQKIKWSIGDSYLRLKKMLLKITPNLEMIDKVNELYEKGYTIILNTSRLWHDFEATVLWLAVHKVKYHTLIMAKPFADLYVDDKNINLEEFRKL